MDGSPRATVAVRRDDENSVMIPHVPMAQGDRAARGMSRQNDLFTEYIGQM